MTAGITTNARTHLRNAARGAAGLTLAGACALGCAGAAFATDSTTYQDTNTGSTLVTVQTDDSNLAFSVPTVIPFVTESDGTLVGPSASATLISNLSVFPIHVTNASVVFDSAWSATTDASIVSTANAVDFQFGPSDDMTDAYLSSDDDVSDSSSYNMAYKGASGDSIAISTAGNINNVTNNLVAGVADELATITWTVSAGNA